MFVALISFRITSVMLGFASLMMASDTPSRNTPSGRAVVVTSGPGVVGSSVPTVVVVGGWVVAAGDVAVVDGGAVDGVVVGASVVGGVHGLVVVAVVKARELGELDEDVVSPMSALPSLVTCKQIIYMIISICNRFPETFKLKIFNVIK